MKLSTIGIIDYGMGNILSVSRAIEKCGAQVYAIHTEKELLNSEALVLPGVGAFGDGMKELNRLNLVNAIRKFAESGRPLLGICLGMQLLLDESEEFGRHEGLGLIAGSVVSVPSKDVSGQNLRLPHVGWAPLIRGKQSPDWQQTLLKNTKEGESVYFVHSYHASPKEKQSILAATLYGGHALTAVVQKKNIAGCQFHPEKSAQAGLRILDAFIHEGALHAV